MKVVISETQYKFFLSESPRKKINIDLSELKRFAEETVGKIKEEFGLQFRMLLTWGAAVGGVMGPLEGFIQRNEFRMTPMEQSLVLTAVCALLYNENKRTVSKLLSLIEKKGLKNTFLTVLNKGEDLKSAFVDFIKSLNVTLSTITQIMSYTFLIPVLPSLWEIAHSGVDVDDVKDITTRLLAFGLTSIAGITLKRVISKIIERFK